MENLGVKLSVGAAIAGSVGQAFGAVRAQSSAAKQSVDRIIIGKSLADSIVKNESLLKKLHAEMEKTGRTAGKIGIERRLIGEIAAARDEAAKLGLSFSDAGKEAAKMGRQVREATARQNFSEEKERNKTARREGAADMAVGVGAAYTFKRLIDQSIEFESVMADVRKVVDFETPEQYAQMQQDILALSRSMPMAASGIGQIIAAAGQAGIARGELQRFAADAIKMGIAFDLSAEEAGGAMTGMRSIFGLTQDGAVKLGDTVNYLSNNMDATAAKMLNVLNRAGSSGKMFGLMGDQVSALAATFIQLKTPPQVAATAMNSIFSRLATAQTQSKEFQTALAGIGYSASALKKDIQQDAQGALIKFLEKVKGAKDPMTTLAQLFGSEFSDDVGKLVLNLDQYKNAVSLAADATAKAGSMQREYESRAATTANNIQLLANQAQEAATKIGASFLPALNDAIKPIGTLASTVADAAGEHPALVGGIMKATAAAIAFKFVFGAGKFFGSYLADGIAVIKFIRAYDFATRAATIKTVAFGAAQRVMGIGAAIWGVVTKASRAFNLSLLANPIVLIGAAFIGVGIAIYKYWEPIKTFFKGLFGDVEEGADKSAAALGKVAGGAKTAQEAASGVDIGSIMAEMGIPRMPATQPEQAPGYPAGNPASATMTIPSGAAPETVGGPVTIQIAGITIQTQSVDAASVPALAKDIAAQVWGQLQERARQNGARGFGDAVVAW